ncbi:UNVERIFIED_CONTAM: hypothetical protein Slati_2198400 [Sesamum latifolium]|uniref:Uncharacterized protein n=1 Tax=Sesamum latifolium TaxID=2727402 RepID=A0AAW2WSQ5_9LAMI
MHPSMARGILARLGITALRMRPQRPSHVHCSLGASDGLRLRCGRFVCLARVGPHLKSETHSICPQCGVAPRPLILANGPAWTA